MTLDHIVLAVPDLVAGVARFHERTGVRPVAGGSHTGLGTANYLVGLGNGSYLEIIGPDPGQPDPDRPRPFGIDSLTGDRVVTWCARPADFDAAVAAAVARGYDPGPPRAMSRLRPDGTLLAWRLTPSTGDPGAGLVPFLIDWGTSAHPTSAGLPELALVGMHGEHPDPDGVRRALAALDLDLPVRPGPGPRLVVTVRGPLGTAELV